MSVLALPAMRRKLKQLAFLALALGPLGCRGAPGVGQFQATLLVQADVGGTILIDPTDDPQLAGASITIPPGALSADTTITLSSSTATVALPGTQAAGIAVAFGPAGTVFRLPVALSLPFSLPAGAAPTQLFVMEVDGSGTREVFQSAGMVVDSTADVIGFQVLALGTFGAVVGPACSSDASCAAASPEACLNGICSGGLSADVALGCGVDGSCLVGESCDAGLCEGGFDPPDGGE